MRLDMHCEMILDEYHEKMPFYEKMKPLMQHNPLFLYNLGGGT